MSALAAVLLKTLISVIEHLLSLAFGGNDGLNYWYLFTPIIGITLAMLFVRYIVRDDISHGITRILYAISQRKSILKLHNTWTSIVGSSLTIGFGGSVGAEAPIVLTGSAIGSNLAKFFKLDQKTMMLMIGCGAAGAIGGIFKAPIAGLVFTLEVLMIDMTTASVIPLLISSVTANAVAYFFTGSNSMFDFSVEQPFGIRSIPYLLILGIACGLVSLYFTRGMNWIEGCFRRITNPYTKLAVGGVMLSVLIFLFPPLYGEGYNTIGNLLHAQAGTTLDNSLLQTLLGNGQWVLLFNLVLIILMKIFASAATNAAGGVGGIFAPSLFVGCITGYVVAMLLNMLGLHLPPTTFALAGMAGLMSGVMHAPLTGIFLIAELTGGYQLFMTLMIVSAVSYMVIILFEPHSLYAMRLAQKGELITHHKDRAVLTLLKMENIIETDLSILRPEQTLGELVRVIAHSRRNLFPVVSKNGRFQGVLLLDEVRNIMFRQELYERFTVGQLMTMPPAVLQNDMPMEKVMEIFEDSGAWNLPVIDQDKRYVGFVSKSKIFNSYRHVLVHFSDE
ncbi:MAG: chloride channel protein [Paludibacteraceae bacterium]|nr:chloride channel protein [Paludibacteraceae bacterium]